MATAHSVFRLILSDKDLTTAIHKNRHNNFATNVLTRRLTAGRKVQGSHTGLQDVPSRSTSTQKRHGSRWGSIFVWKLRWEIAQGGCDVTTSDTWWYVQTFGGKN